MNRSFSLNLLFLLLLNFIVKPVWLFGIEVGVQNAVGAESYGIYYALFNFTFLFNIVLDLGVSNYQRVATARNESEGIGSLTHLIVVRLGLSLLYIGLTTLAAGMVGYPPGYWFFIGFLMLNQVLMSFLLLFRATLGGLHRFIRDSFLSVFDRFLMILAIGYILLTDAESMRIEWFVMAQTGAYVLSIVMALAMLPLRQINWSLSFEWSKVMELVKASLPFGLLILLMSGFYRVDGVMLERLLPDGERAAGIYAQAYRLLDAGNNFAFLYAGLLLPMFARFLKSKREEVHVLANQAAVLLVAPAGIVAILAFFFGGLFMGTLYDSYAQASARALPWLMGSFVFVCIGNVFGTLITASGKLWKLNVLACVTFVANIILNLILIPQYQWEGAAIASFFSLLLMAVGQLVLSRWEHGIRLWSWMWKSALVWLAFFAVSILIISIDAGVWVKCFLATAVGVLLYLIGFRRSLVAGVQQVIQMRSGKA